MLDELKNLNSPGNLDGFLFLLGSVIADKQLPYEDIRILCSYAPGGSKIVLPEMVQYCTAFGWIQDIDGLLSLTPEILDVHQNACELNHQIICKSIGVLFESQIFNINMFSFDALSNKTLFRNELFPLNYSVIRNTLINIGFFEVSHSLHGTTFYVSDMYEKVLSKICKTEKKKLTLSQLRKKLESDAEIGEKAEQFSLMFEQRRITNSLSEKIKIISDIDVTAGYDLLSYESNDSVDYDRFIEVKAASRDMGFFWSRNEYEMAKLKGEHYYLYLVDVGQIDKPGYVPKIIQNPAESVMESSDWMVEPQSYHIYHV